MSEHELLNIFKPTANYWNSQYGTCLSKQNFPVTWLVNVQELIDSVAINNDHDNDRKCGCGICRAILGLHPANERCRYKVTPSLIGWAQT